jgi:hypothetical protein
MKDIKIFSKTPSKFIWKRRPSEIRGYHRTLYINLDNGDYLRVDYNLQDKKVRIYVEDSGEGGNAYFSIIKNGVITLEKSVASGRAAGFSDKFISRSEVFSTIPNAEVIKVIGGNYKIGDLSEVKKSSDIEVIKKKYFRHEIDQKSNKEPSFSGISGNIKFIDFVDVVIGVFGSLLIFIFLNFNFMVTGVITAFYGLILGFIDIFFRERNPLILKILFFIFGGIFIYIYGYLN